MKKKFISLVLILVMSVSILSGCNLFGTDWESYYNAVVASINYSYTINGTAYTYKEDITKRELLTAYNSYGYNYVNNYNYTAEKATQATLDTIIERKLQITAVENFYKQNNEELFTDAEKTYLWDQTREAVLSNFQNYYNEVMGITDEEAGGEDSDNIVYTPYQSKATLKYNTDSRIYTIKSTTPVSTIRFDGEVKYYEDLVYDYEYKNQDGKYLFKDIIKDIVKEYTNDVNYRAAYNRYIKAVKENYSYKNFTDNDEVFMFEMDRIYDIVRDNYVVEKYDIVYNAAAGQGATLTNVKAEKILEQYEDTIKQEYQKYANNKTLFDTDIVSSSNNLSYIYEKDDATNYFNVAMIKLSNFENDYKPEDALNDLNNGKITEVEYNAKLKQIYSQAYTYIKDTKTGEVTDQKIKSQALLDEITNTLNSYTNKYLDFETVMGDTLKVKQIVADSMYIYDDLTQKEIEDIVKAYVEERNTYISYDVAEAFVKYFYYYNDDTTYLNKDNNAVFGVSQSKEAVYSSDLSDVNEDFEKAIVALYNNGNAKIGDLSAPINTDNGVYILFYAGEVKNVFSGINQNFNLSRQDIAKLANTRVNIFSSKTIFDSIYETLVSDTLFDSFRSENIKVLKKELTTGNNTGIVKFPDAYKDMF